MDRRDFLRLSILGASNLVLPQDLLSYDFFSNDYTLETCSQDFQILKTPIKKTLTDIFVEENERRLFDTTFFKIKKVLNRVGYGNFNSTSLDYAFKSVKFSKNEKNLIEKLFEFDAKEYGFNGKKVITDITNEIHRKDIIKIKGTGHYLFKEVKNTYTEMIKEAKITDSNVNPILTSGVRNVFKQIYLFMNKTRKVNYNLSEASTFLAPPGHSYHGISDFDIGKKGYGSLNFESDFEKTEEFKTLTDLGYLHLRYGKNNNQGVIYEPWHVKVDKNRV